MARTHIHPAFKDKSKSKIGNEKFDDISNMVDKLSGKCDTSITPHKGYHLSKKERDEFDSILELLKDLIDMNIISHKDSRMLTLLAISSVEIGELRRMKKKCKNNLQEYKIIKSLLKDEEEKLNKYMKSFAMTVDGRLEITKKMIEAKQEEQDPFEVLTRKRNKAKDIRK